MAQEKQTGTVKWFSSQKGYGFITPDDGSEDLFVHQTSIISDGFRSLTESEPVEFVIEQGDDGRTRAVDVTGPNGSTLQGTSFGGAGGRGRGAGGYSFGGGGGGGGRGGYGRGRGRGAYGGGGGGYGSGGGGGYGSGGGGGCYTCGEPGHLARDCVNGGGGGGGGRGGGRSGGGRACYNCGESGHFARDCRQQFS